MIYLPEMTDKIKDTIEGLKGNWQEYKNHEAATEADNVHGLQDMIQTLTALFGAEYGKNENGNWIRFNFGLQVCWTYVYAWPDAKADSTFGNVYRSSVNLLWTYPKAFVEEPAVSGACTGNAWIGDFRGASEESKTDFQFRVFRGLVSSADPSIRLKAIGWWKTPEDPAEWSEE